MISLLVVLCQWFLPCSGDFCVFVFFLCFFPFKRCMMMENDGTRRRGLPRKVRWDCVMEDMKSLACPEGR